MSSIIFNSVSFYHNISDKLFRDLSLNIDTCWRLGIVGRNGRGKTTLLNLIRGELQPVEGSVSVPVKPFYFPYKVEDTTARVLDIIRDAIAPFKQMEEQMNILLAKADEESLRQYGELLELFTGHSGYEIDSLIEREFTDLGMDASLLGRPFNTLSGGEQTRALLVPLFLRSGSYPLIDEPTNHLDMPGREQLGKYLAKKSGFMLVSHDRSFLDICIDHVLSINKSDVRLNKGNYSQWKENMDLEQEFEMRKQENIKREVKSLEAAALKRRTWSGLKEKEKIGAEDKGFIGRRSAKLMKRALSIEHRINDRLEEKKSLLLNKERDSRLKLNTAKPSSNKLLGLNNITLKFDGVTVIDDLSFDVSKGNRIAITGKNGSGKTSLLKILTKEIKDFEGTLYLPGHLKIAYAAQIPEWSTGYLREHLIKNKIDETKFRNILGAIGSEGEIFERPLETFSKGEIKKVSLCRSFVDEPDLFIWDEPLNYLDIMSRELIENAITEFKPTMIFTEHDRTFIENTATDIIELG